MKRRGSCLIALLLILLIWAILIGGCTGGCGLGRAPGHRRPLFRRPAEPRSVARWPAARIANSPVSLEVPQVPAMPPRPRGSFPVVVAAPI